MQILVSNLNKSYSKDSILEDINLCLDEGLHALIAPNGAGKTTLIRMLATVLKPTKGTISLDGMDIFENSVEFCKFLGYLPQNLGYYAHYNVKQYLNYMAALKGLSVEVAKERISSLIKQMSLETLEKKQLSKLSGGMLRRVGLAMALLNNPQILLLDEPTAGLDPNECKNLKLLLSGLSKDHIILVSTHIISDIEYISKNIILLRDKKIYTTGSKEELAKLVEGKVFETNVPLSDVENMQKKYKVITFQNNKDLAKVRFLAETSSPDITWEPCDVTLEDIVASTYESNTEGV